MRNSTGTSGCSMVSYTIFNVGSASICGHRLRCSCSVTSAVLSGIFRARVHVHLIEGDLLRALARDVFVMQWSSTPRYFCGGRIHVVARGNAVEHVGLEHGIEALALERDAVVREHVRVVLQMMPELSAVVGSSSSGFKAASTLSAVELLAARPHNRGRAARMPLLPARPRMTSRRCAPACSRDCRSRSSKEMSGAAASFASHASSASCEIILLIVARGAAARCDGDRRRTRVARLRRLAAASTAGGPRRRGSEPNDLSSARNSSRVYSSRSRGEIGRAGSQPLRRVISSESAVSMVASLRDNSSTRQFAAQIFADLAADVGGVGNQPIERLILIQPLRRGLRPDAGDAGNIVRTVADQRQVVDDLLGKDIELRLDADAIEARVAHGVDQFDVRTHQLRHVLVAGRDQHLDSPRPPPVSPTCRSHRPPRRRGRAAAAVPSRRPRRSSGCTCARRSSGMGVRCALY